jgi:hypothetical protein
MTAQRFSFYKHIHKAIRAVAHDMVERAQRTDFTQPLQVEELSRVVAEAFSIFEGHADKETEFVTPVLRVCAPSLAADSDGEHREQELRLRDLRRALQAAARGGPSAPVLGHAFVVGLSRLEGEMLLHMADEEERLMPALWAAFDDAALERIHHALLASIPPPHKVQVLGWMLPALAAPERTELLSSLRATVPPPAFEALRGLAQRVLPAADWDRLEADLATAA